MKKRVVNVNDHMQKYVYTCTKPIGKHFHPDFRPMLTPQEMLELGVFGGVYMRDCKDEFPKSWFTRAKLAEGKRDKNLNYFKVLAGQSLRVWQEKGWIFKDDPRGWFQWYSRYYMGRRLKEEDERQIKRWKAFARHAAQVTQNCRKGDEYCRPKQRQALLQWAYDSRGI